MSIGKNKKFIKYNEEIQNRSLFSIYEELLERNKRLNAHLTRMMILLGRKENEQRS